LKGKLEPIITRPAHDRGAALLIMMIILMSGIALALMSGARRPLASQKKSQLTNQALNDAKEALIAWSVSHADTAPGPSVRPGELPCPDFNDDGIAETICPAGQLGRLPWKTLGIPPAQDGQGNDLWYAVGAGFRTASLDPAGINSDQAGSLSLYDNTGGLMTPLGQRLAAVIVSPGDPLADQSGRRSSVAADYVEAALGRDNRTVGGPFITGPVRDTDGLVRLNDVILGVQASDLVAAADRRALSEAQRALLAYMAANGNKAPNPADPSNPACLGAVANVAAPTACPSDATRCFGRLPEDALAPYAAPWFITNGWGRVMPYAVRLDMAADSSGSDCTLTLTMNGSPVQWIVLSTGSPLSNPPGPISQTRPSVSLSNYLEDPANQNAWTAHVANQGVFVTPTAGNDRARTSP